jgi:hypothetical protein
MLIRRIRSNIAQLGWLDGTLFMLGRVLQLASGGRARLYRYYLVAQPVAPLPAPCRPAPGHTLRLARGLEAPLQTLPRPEGVLARRIANGDRCIIALKDGELAGCLWMARNGYEEDEVRCRYQFAVPACSSWDYDVHVEPRYRLGRTFSRLWDYANRQLAAEGVRWSFSRISAFNPGSLRAHARLGARCLFSATFLCIGPLQLTLAGARPYVHLALRRSTRPILNLAPPPEREPSLP